MPKSLLKKTVKGENFLGRTLNKVLPFPKAREAVGAAIHGTKRGLPVPEFDDADREAAADEALKKVTENPNNLKRDELIKVIYQVRDILDNGKADGSANALNPKTRVVIEKAFSALPLIAYLVYAISTGDFSLSALIELFQ